MKAAILTLILLSCVPAHAAGTLRHDLTEAVNLVAGTTATALYRDLLRHPIIDPDSGRAFANLTHDHALELSTKQSAGQCRVEKLEFTWHFVMTLPKVRDESALPASTRPLWRSFVTRLRTHELHHRDLFVACGEAFVPSAAAMTAPQCSTLERNIRRTMETQYDACMARQRAYDRADTPDILAHPFLRLAQQD